MPPVIVALLLALGCSGTAIDTPMGPAAAVWICPPPEAEPAMDAPPPPPPETRPA